MMPLKVSKYPETLDTRRDLKLLKWVWDFKSLCDKLFESWKQQVTNPLLTLSLSLCMRPMHFHPFPPPLVSDIHCVF